MYLSSKLYAFFMKRSAERINPRLANIKRLMFGDLAGRVVEIGPGSGSNLPFLPENIHYVGIEPNAYLREHTTVCARAIGFRSVTMLKCGAQDMSFLSDGSVDAVISTFVLCSVPDQHAVLREIHRVLKPNGRFIYIEHVAASKGSVAYRLQKLLTPLTRRIACGCELCRDTVSVITQSGFQLAHNYSAPTVSWRPLGPLAAGIAVRV